jgi:hypothetical protein
MEVDIAKIDEMVGEAVSELTGWKGAVEAATTADITLSGAQTIDGVAVVAGELVLVKNQTDAEDNGIYVCDADTWERSEKMLLGSSAAGAAVYVTKGTANGDKVFICTNDIGSDVVGTDDLVFSALVTSPAGSDTQIQYNDGGVMAGDAGLTFNETTNIVTAAGGVTVTDATGGLNLTKGTVTIADFAAGAATVVARQGIITVTSAILAADTAANIVVTATAMVAATDLILVGINARSATDGAPVAYVSARTAPNTFTITVRNGDDATGMTGSMTIGYVIM